MLRNTDVEGPIFCPILTKFELSRQINVKVYNTKLHGNKSSSRSADRCWYTDEQTDMTKVTGTMASMRTHLETGHHSWVKNSLEKQDKGTGLPAAPHSMHKDLQYTHLNQFPVQEK